MVAYLWYVPAFGQLLSKECLRAQARGHIRRMSYGCLRNDDLRSLGRVVEGLNGCVNRDVVRNRCRRHDISDICTEKLKSVQRRCGCVNEPARGTSFRNGSRSIKKSCDRDFHYNLQKKKRYKSYTSSNIQSYYRMVWFHSKYRNVGLPLPVAYALTSAARFKEINSLLNT